MASFAVSEVEGVEERLLGVVDRRGPDLGVRDLTAGGVAAILLRVELGERGDRRAADRVEGVGVVVGDDR